MKTRTAYLVAPRTFEIRERDVAPSPEEVLVKVAACGLCHWEMNHWKGTLGTPPLSLGHEYVGEIVEMGEAVPPDLPGIAVGSIVTGLPRGLVGFSDYAVFKATDCFAVDRNLPAKYAIGEPLKCVVTVLRAAAAEVGDHGVVIGCGPMGLWAIQGLASRNLGSLTAIDTDEQRLELAKTFGATGTVNPRMANPNTAVRETTGGHMADFVIEATGIPKVLETGMDILRKGRGRLILMSSHEGPAETFDLRRAIENGIELRVAHPSYSQNQSDDMRRATDLLNRGVFRTRELITHEFPLEKITEAFNTLEHGAEGYLKGIVVP